MIPKDNIIEGGIVIKLRNLTESIPVLVKVIALILLFVNSSELKKMHNTYLWIIFISLFLFAFFIELFQDIMKKQYSTKILIIVADVFEIAAFLTLCYFQFNLIDRTDIDRLIKRATNLSITSLLLILMPYIKSVLKGRRFEKKQKEL